MRKDDAFKVISGATPVQYKGHQVLELNVSLEVTYGTPVGRADRFVKKACMCAQRGYDFPEFPRLNPLSVGCSVFETRNSR